MEEEIFKIGGWPGRFRVTHLRLVVTDAHTNWGFGKEIMTLGLTMLRCLVMDLKLWRLEKSGWRWRFVNHGYMD